MPYQLRTRACSCPLSILSAHIALSLLLNSSDAAAAPQPVPTATVNIEDSAPFHVHPAGQPIRIKLTVDYPTTASVQYQWRNANGQALSKPAPLQPGLATQLESPDSSIGYYGLTLISDGKTALPDRRPDEMREYGFAILPPRTIDQRQADPEAPIGIVHADKTDPYLPTWIKTATWDTHALQYWPREMAKRRSLGTLELPIIVGSDWDLDDTKPVTTEQLQKLKERAQALFQSDLDTRVWELGIEENLGKRYRQTFYWPNLEAKARAIREAAQASNPTIQLVYQVAELRRGHIEAFLKSGAAKQFDILALHPYAWPDFRDPGSWLPDFIQQTRKTMTKHHRSMPIWFTEVGAPQRGNHPKDFFGYPKSGKQVPGQSRMEAAVYLTKLNVIALQQGIGKVFWYNHKDRHPEREYAENHFGLVDYWGYPKPSYLAFVQLHQYLSDKKPAKNLHTPAPGVTAYRFENKNNIVWSLWSHTPQTHKLSLTQLDKHLKNVKHIRATNVLGASIKLVNHHLPLSNTPVWLAYSR